MTEIIRNDLKEEQNTVAQQYKTNPKIFWKYVNSKTKHIEKTGDLKKKDEHGNIVICNAAEAKADVLCEFLGKSIRWPKRWPLAPENMTPVN